MAGDSEGRSVTGNHKELSDYANLFDGREIEYSVR